MYIIAITSYYCFFFLLYTFHLLRMFAASGCIATAPIYVYTRVLFYYYYSISFHSFFFHIHVIIPSYVYTQVYI